MSHVNADQAATRLCSKDTVKDTGLNIWVSGEGLGAHPYHTWVRRHSPTGTKPTKRHRLGISLDRHKNAQTGPPPDGSPTASETAEVMWLRDLLPGLVPNARIATYSYTSDWRKADVKTSLRKCGEQLLNVLFQNRSTKNDGHRRPLIFIGHSLGGLIVKQALVLADHDEREAKLLETLASDYRSDKELVSARVPGTCEWFFEDDRFLEWRDSSKSRLLWVSAGPGCGKSVLARALIDERRVCKDTTASTVCYFFFKDGQEQRTRGANALSALLHQLFDNTNLITHALPSYKRYGEKLRDEFSELWEVLVKATGDSKAGEIICILDALDECEENARNQIMEKLLRFCSQEETRQNLSSKLKFLVTSRPYDDLEQKFHRLSDVSTYMRFDGNEKSHEIGQEINLVIDAKIPHIMGDFSDENRKRISDRLKEMDHRTYLWLFLTIDIIEKSPSRFRRKSDIDSLLFNLPSEISDAYERILSRSVDEEKARILLELIIAATRPLSIEEANMALTIATQGKICKAQRDLELWPLQSFASTVQNMCGLFVSVHDGKLFLIHQTAREFLIETSKSVGTPHKWKGCLGMAAAHGTMFRICFDYLNLEDVASFRRDQKQNFYLINYAANNWDTHYNSQADNLAKDSLKAARSLCNTSLPQGNWIRKRRNISFSNYIGSTELGIASMLGLTYVVEECLNEGADINAQGVELIYNTALQAASANGHIEIVGMLLKKGADVNAQGDTHHNTALQIASANGYIGIVRTLLEKGADINAQGGYYNTALQTASTRGHSETVRLLLENGADINAQGGFYNTALQAASECGYIETVRILLENGANVNAQGGTICETALRAASRRGHSETVRLLLENGADINAQGGLDRTALQAASECGNIETVRILLEKGADVNAQHGYYNTALQAASVKGHKEIVGILLEKGADVNVQYGYYNTPLQAASANGYDQVVRILLDKGADVNAQGGYYNTALQAASANDYDQVVRILLDKGADIDAQDQVFGNALQQALRGRHEVVVRLLRNHGAAIPSFGSNPTLTDVQGRNCLHHAASAGSTKIISWLLKRGFDPNRADRDGWTSLHWAARNGDVSTREILKAAGAISTIEAIKGWTPNQVATSHHNEPISTSDVDLAHENAKSELVVEPTISYEAAAVKSMGHEFKISPSRKTSVMCDGCLLASLNFTRLLKILL
ncbi:MAG: hypothetical protein Q9161_007415 [Pseudevernia consocians]